ncbi:MAG: neutral zinc metallopeptidase [Acidimicrobiia bacterium]
MQIRRVTRFAALTMAVLTTAGALSLGSVPADAAPRATGSSRAAYERAIDQAVTAVQAYWSREFPKLYGKRYQPVPRARVIAAEPGVKLPSCQGQRLTYQDAVGNAFYCFDDNFVVYDDAKLFPQLRKVYGDFAIALVLAHEWGHAIQDRAGNDNQPTIDRELQADCFAGAWTDDQSGRSSGPKLSGGDLEASLAALLTFRDSPGTSPDDASAHGSAFDRVSAFQEGFESGPERCKQYFDSPPLVVELPFSSAADQASGGQAPADEVIPLSVELLNDFYSQVEPSYVPLRTDSIAAFDSTDRSTIPKCGGSTLALKQVRNRVFYCIDDKYVAFDQPFLQQIYDQIGDFGVTSLVAGPFATRVQKLQGEPGVEDNGLAIVLQADCYTGGFTAAFYNGALNGATMSPGDLDEVVEAFLAYDRARGVSQDVPITFLRLGYFRRGFFSGYQSCDLATIQNDVKNF